MSRFSWNVPWIFMIPRKWIFVFPADFLTFFCSTTIRTQLSLLSKRNEHMKCTYHIHAPQRRSLFSSATLRTNLTFLPLQLERLCSERKQNKISPCVICRNSTAGVYQLYWISWKLVSDGALTVCVGVFLCVCLCVARLWSQNSPETPVLSFHYSFFIRSCPPCTDTSVCAAQGEWSCLHRLCMRSRRL